MLAKRTDNKIQKIRVTDTVTDQLRWETHFIEMTL